MVAQMSEPQSMSDFVESLAESSSDVAVESESRSEAVELHDEQSSSPTEQVAPDTGTEQPDEPADDVAGQGEGSPEPDLAAPSVNWDSPENPYFQKMEAIRQLAEQQRAEQEAKAAEERWKAGFLKLNEVDESDVEGLAGDLISDIRTHAVRPYEERIDVLEHGLTAVVAAIETVLTPAQVEAVKKEAANKRAYADTAGDLDAAVRIERDVRTKAQAEAAALRTEITNLKAQLAAKVITDTGVNRSETVAVGASDPVDSWDSLLSGRI